MGDDGAPYLLVHLFGRNVNLGHCNHDREFQRSGNSNVFLPEQRKEPKGQNKTKTKKGEKAFAGVKTSHNESESGMTTTPEQATAGDQQQHTRTLVMRETPMLAPTTTNP